MLKQLYVLLGEGLIFRILFLKMLKLSEFRINLSILFYSVITEEKNEFREQIVFKMKKWYISRQSCVMRSG